MSDWILEYYNKYQQAPKSEMQNIYFDKVVTISEDEASLIEDVLDSIAKEQGDIEFELAPAIDRTEIYFRSRKVELLKENLDPDYPEESEKEIESFQPLKEEESFDIDLFEKDNKTLIKEAFAQKANPLINFDGAFGVFMNKHLVPGGFISILGPEKRGKTWALMEFVFQSVIDGNDTLFIQAGDMSEHDMIRRIGIRLCGNSDTDEYCKNIYIPEVDCEKNQLDYCDFDQRLGHSPYCINLEELKTYDALVERINDFPDYIPCRNCPYLKGSVILRKRHDTIPITWKDAYKAFLEFKERYPAKLKLATFPADSLSTSHIKRILKDYKKNGFEPSVIVIDYADILGYDKDTIGYDFRNKENTKWKRLRSIANNKEFNQPLLITATQADANSYNKDLLDASNFSETKGKHAHITKEIGLNQTPEEKEIGIMRINDIMTREGKSHTIKPVKITQRLEIGRFILDSFF
jgi:hypothetical protein